MLTKEIKLQIFQKLRSENYRASLRLEGLGKPKPDGIKPVAQPATAPRKTKHV